MDFVDDEGTVVVVRRTFCVWMDEVVVNIFSGSLMAGGVVKESILGDSKRSGGWGRRSSVRKIPCFLMRLLSMGEVGVTTTSFSYKLDDRGDTVVVVVDVASGSLLNLFSNLNWLEVRLLLSVKEK